MPTVRPDAHHDRHLAERQYDGPHADRQFLRVVAVQYEKALDRPSLDSGASTARSVPTATSSPRNTVVEPNVGVSFQYDERWMPDEPCVIPLTPFKPCDTHQRYRSIKPAETALRRANCSSSPQSLLQVTQRLRSSLLNPSTASTSPSAGCLIR